MLIETLYPLATQPSLHHILPAMSLCLHLVPYLDKQSYTCSNPLGGTLVSAGTITVGDLTSLLLYTVYVGGGLQMLTYVKLC